MKKGGVHRPKEKGIKGRRLPGKESGYIKKNTEEKMNRKQNKKRKKKGWNRREKRTRNAGMWEKERDADYLAMSEIEINEY